MFKLQTKFTPEGDQPKAIKEIVTAFKNKQKQQTLMGATGTGKTFTIANVIQQVQKPTLVIAHNKTLAAQLCSEFKEFFPENAVNYFVSYYDYYQPEAYIARTDTYIEKDASINEEIDKYRHAATRNLLTRKDVIIVSSVSCIYGLGPVEEYSNVTIHIIKGMKLKRDVLLADLAHSQYHRNDIKFTRGTFRARGEIVEIYPVYSDTSFRIEFFGDEVESITESDPLTGELYGDLKILDIYPAKHAVTNQDIIKKTVKKIQAELVERLAELKAVEKHIEAHRLEQRTNYDIEMLLETGYCTGIENYSRYLSGREEGDPAETLIDYFPKDFLMVIDESHMTIPQIGGMYAGDRSRKTSLIEHGFRMKSALDNRPLQFSEFEKKVNQVVYVSATPRPYEIEKAKHVIVEQIIRPTGLVDPQLEVRPTSNQIDDLISEINLTIARKERCLITTLTKRMSEELTDYLKELEFRVRYLHSDIDTMERIEILRDLRAGKFDILVGINLLREGLDLPEVSFIAILDADKEGFLRSAMALIQVIGRAARNVNGKVVMYADKITNSMKKAIDETERRRAIQEAHNKKHHIIPKTIIKDIKDIYNQQDEAPKFDISHIPLTDRKKMLADLEIEMDLAASELNYEKAAELRDQIESLKNSIK